MLSAMKEALDEAIQEARERGDLTSDRAREVLGRAAERAREATSDARERFDFPTRADFEALSARVSELERRVGGRLSDVPDDDEGGRGEGGTGAGA
jgi:polyhydroxyalkanoate synthesis regulator phasin